MSSPFSIDHTPGNRDNSLPEHWDVTVKGQADSIITVWDSEAMARECVRFLEGYKSKGDA